MGAVLTRLFDAATTPSSDVKGAVVDTVADADADADDTDNASAFASACFDSTNVEKRLCGG